MSEILAPAGDRQSALAAINAGADAIYLGLTDFSARSSASNFDWNEFGEISALARLFGVKIYVAMNTVVKAGELENFIETAVKAWNSGADAIILQDIFLGEYLKSAYPQMVLHLSTQAGVCNAYGARLAESCGFSRVILARETAIEDIREISGIIQTEAFVQGALCTCFSGQCYLSSFAGGNSGNRGKCKQPCRKRYKIDRAGFEEAAYDLSLADLSYGGDICKLIEAGVYSFKIEGRMRRPEYVSAAVGYYRDILSGNSGENYLSALKRTYNRGNYTKGLAFGQDKTLISSAVQGHIGEYLGKISIKNGKYFCPSPEPRHTGDGFKILRKGKEVCGASFLSNADGGFYLSSGTRLLCGDGVYITTDAELNNSLLKEERKLPVKLSFYCSEGEKMRVEIDGEEFISDFPALPAQNKPMTVEDVIKCFDKTDIYPFEISYGGIDICGRPFVPVSALNAFRREVYAAYFNGRTRVTNAKIEKIAPLPANKAGKASGKTAVIARDLRGVKADIGILKPDDYSGDFHVLARDFGGEKFLYLPPYLTGAEIERLKPAIKSFGGIYCDGNYACVLSKELGVKLFAGTGFNITQPLALTRFSDGYVALSKELSRREAAPLVRDNCFYLTAGAIKVMDLIYCPFSKACATCDKRDFYNLSDEQGRAFPMRRYRTSQCRFELYNCNPLVGEDCGCNALYDFTAEPRPAEVCEIAGDSEKLKGHYPEYTKGHCGNPVA